MKVGAIIPIRISIGTDRSGRVDTDRSLETLNLSRLSCRRLMLMVDKLVVLGLEVLKETLLTSKKRTKSAPTSLENCVNGLPMTIIAHGKTLAITHGWQRELRDCCKRINSDMMTDEYHPQTQSAFTEDIRVALYSKKFVMSTAV